MGTYDWLKEKYPGNIPVAVAAKIMNKPVGFVQLGLETGTLRFGSYTKNSRCSFHISPDAFIRYMEGRDEPDIRSMLDEIARTTAQATIKEFIKKGGAL